MKLYRDKFFQEVRSSLFGGRLSTGQVEGMEVLMDEAERLGWHDSRHFAYLLATAYWETGKTMQPIDERGSDAYFFRMYDIKGDRPRVAQTLGNTQEGDGVKFHGRGFVQITGRANYVDMSKRIHLNLVENPELVKNHEVAAVIIFIGMEKGTFTGRKLSHFFNDTTSDPVGARRIINGTDKAEEIAEIYRKFLPAIDNSRVSVTTTVESIQPEFERRLQRLEDLVEELRQVFERFN